MKLCGSAAWFEKNIIDLAVLWCFYQCSARSVVVFWIGLLLVCLGLCSGDPGKS